MSDNADEAAIKNDALRISMEWGPRRSMPYEMRIREVHPQLLDHQIHDLETLSNEIQSAAWGSVVQAMKSHHKDEQAAQQTWRNTLRKKWPWLSDANLGAAWTQGCYYAWHDGELQ